MVTYFRGVNLRLCATVVDMSLLTKEDARILLHQYVSDEYQRFHAEMVAAAMVEYARKFGEDEWLWWFTGYMHDIDYDMHPTEHPGPSLSWFKEWGYSEELIHAVEAHADGFNGFTTKPETKLAKTLIACDEICGIFYAYQKLNPIPFSEMKVSSIRKRLKETKFAPGIDRSHIYNGCEHLGVELDDHIETLIKALAVLEQK